MKYEDIHRQYYTGFKVVGKRGNNFFSLNYPEKEFNLKLGDYIKSDKGIYLGTSKKFVEDYYTGLVDDENDESEMILTFKYSSDDIISGNPDDESAEILVKRAQLVSIETT